MRKGLGRPQSDDSLFVWPWVYRWGLLFEYSISAYWVGIIRRRDKRAGVCCRWATSLRSTANPR